MSVSCPIKSLAHSMALIIPFASTYNGFGHGSAGGSSGGGGSFGISVVGWLSVGGSFGSCVVGWLVTGF